MKPIILALFSLVLIAHAEDRLPKDLIAAISIRPWPGENFPILPNLSTELRGFACNEIAASTIVRDAITHLDPKNSNIAWFEALKILEQQKAIWCLQACLTHPSDDVQINALRALARLKDSRAVPFLLIYGDYMAVMEGGSENATLHGIIHQEIAHTLGALTGTDIKLQGQDADGLKKGLILWTTTYLKKAEQDAAANP